LSLPTDSSAASSMLNLNSGSQPPANKSSVVHQSDSFSFVQDILRKN
jgi:hypothetical protein